MSLRKRGPEKGFTLIEVVVAIFVLTVGLLSAAMLAANVLTGVKRSKYMSLAASLATEKIEDLNRWEADNPQICVPAASASIGNLAADLLQTTTCANLASGSVNYYDDANVSLSGGVDCPGGTAGCFSETVSRLNAGATVYDTTYHSPDGTVTLTTSPNPPVGTTFHRRWLIEKDTPVVGVRRLTVLVTLTDVTVKPPVTFQMSTVRP